VAKETVRNAHNRGWIVLLAIGAVYFAACVAPNLRGAADPGMLAVFETDEYAQYPHVIRMLTPGDSFYQSVRNFVVYLHYFYGYPFYFFSALSLLPLKLLLGADWAQHTQWIVLALRQMIGVLPMLLAAGLLARMQGRSRAPWQSAAVFAFLLLVPAVVVNNFWWHPDSLLVLFVVLTLFLLDRDRQRYGRNFFLAAAACGLATGTKYMGLFFFLAVPLYLLWGIFGKKIHPRRALGLGALFVLLMAAALLASNPLLLLPQERAEIIATQRLQFQQTNLGYWTVNRAAYLTWSSYPEDFRLHYGEAWFLLLALIGLGVGIWRKERRLTHVLILAYVLPYMLYFLFIATTRRTHYFLPAMLPLFSCLINLLPASLPRRGLALGQWARWAALLLILAQLGLFARQDVHLYTAQVNKERDSAALRFGAAVEQQVLPKLAGRDVRIYHDWKAYLPPAPGRTLEMRWELADEETLRALNPDVILLERANIQLFSAPDALANAINPGNMAALRRVYLAAGADELPGYRVAFQDAYGLALVREQDWDRFSGSP
jgi:4-amino-4-deoxy-L-arabinose transferase-like glycosyltransferase